MSGSAKNQNAILQFMQAGIDYSIDRLCEGSGVTRWETIKTAGRLVERAYLCRRENGIFALTQCGIEAKKSGIEIKSGPMGANTAWCRKPDLTTLRQKAWSAMRIMVIFSVNDLVSVAVDDPTKQDHENIRRYCCGLTKAGFLFEMPTRERGSSESSNGFKRYRLFSNTGEIAPVHRVRRDDVFDHNTREAIPCQA